jgi:hypothetical protein
MAQGQACQFGCACFLRLQAVLDRPRNAVSGNDVRNSN